MGFFDKIRGAGKSYEEMSDRELRSDLRHGVGKNTGESVSARAHKIMEAEKRGLDWKPDQKK